MKELSLLDVARLDALKRALKAPQIIKGPNDFARLSKMVHQGQQRKVREILEKRTSEMVAYWMREMGSKRGRPRVHRPLVNSLVNGAEVPITVHLGTGPNLSRMSDLPGLNYGESSKLVVSLLTPFLSGSSKTRFLHLPGTQKVVPVLSFRGLELA